MDLLLWRHAEAADGEPDEARPLTRRGEGDARTMARWLKPRLPAELRILVSPARRAQQTAAALRADFETVDEIGTDADAARLIAAAGWPDSKRPVMLVGHQPTLGEAAALLLSGRESSWRIAKGAVWWLRTRKNGTGAVLVLALDPGFLEGGA